MSQTRRSYLIAQLKGLGAYRKEMKHDPAYALETWRDEALREHKVISSDEPESTEPALPPDPEDWAEYEDRQIGRMDDQPDDWTFEDETNHIADGQEILNEDLEPEIG